MATRLPLATFKESPDNNFLPEEEGVTAAVAPAEVEAG